MTVYDATFFEYVNAGSVRSAERLLPELVAPLNITSILDVGCGQGAWLSVWKKLGINDVTGIDGDYVNRDHLLFPGTHFLAKDLSQPFDLEQKFDLVQCLEVAEHIPDSCAAGLVDSLVRHGDLVFFSAAPKGQGGDGHINEQPYEYWRKLFATHNYIPLDFLRPRLKAQTSIEPWYRYNTMLYVAKEKLHLLPEEAQKTRIADDRPIADISPAGYKLRKLMIRCLPVFAMTLIAKMKERLVLQKLSARAH